MKSLNAMLVSLQVNKAKHISTTDLAKHPYARMMLLHHIRTGMPIESTECLLVQSLSATAWFNLVDSRCQQLPVSRFDISTYLDSTFVSLLRVEGSLYSHVIMDGALNPLVPMEDYLNAIGSRRTTQVPAAFGWAYRLGMSREAFSRTIQTQYLSQSWQEVFSFNSVADAILLANLGYFLDLWYYYNRTTRAVAAPNFMGWTTQQAWEFISYFLTSKGHVDLARVKLLHVSTYYTTESNTQLAMA